MLFEIEQKVSYLSELSVHSESLLLEGRAETKGEAEQLTFKLRSLKDSLLELQQMLQDKQVDIQVRSEVMCVFVSPPSIFLCSPVPCLQFPSPPHSHIFFHLPAFPASVPFLHYVTLSNSINGSIVQTLKVVSCSFIKVHCFPRWNNKSLCVSQWASNNRQKDATSSHANTKCTASGVFLMTQHFGLFAVWFSHIWEKQLLLKSLNSH